MDNKAKKENKSSKKVASKKVAKEPAVKTKKDIKDYSKHWGFEAVDGTFIISICKKDGKPDKKKAKEIFNYCKNNYNWFKSEESDEYILALDENKIVNFDQFPINIKNISIDNFDWLIEAQKNTAAERIIASVDLKTGKLCSDECHYIEELIEQGEIKEIKHIQYFKNPVLSGKITDGNFYYVLDSESHRTFKAKFINKKTKIESLHGFVCVCPKDKSQDIFSACSENFPKFNKYKYGFMDDNGNFIKMQDSKNHDISATFEIKYKFNHFQKGYDPVAGNIFANNDQNGDIEFIGFECEPNYFDIYSKD